MMRSVLLVSLLVSASAFSPSVYVPCQTGSAACRSALSSAPTLRSARRMSSGLRMVGLPFGGKNKPEKERFGGESPYRVFGVTEDAPYEEVETAYKELCKEHEGDDKYLIKLEMMKEAIFDDRLKARMSGALKSKVVDSPFERKLIVKKDPWYSKIAWLAKIVKKPTKKYATQVSILMSCFIFAGIFAPQLSSTTMGFGFLSAMGFLYNRGTRKSRVTIWGILGSRARRTTGRWARPWDFALSAAALASLWRRSWCSRSRSPRSWLRTLSSTRCSTSASWPPR